MNERRRTSTSNFGVGARESHDASGFYGRFRAPDISTDDTVVAPTPVAEPFVVGDARNMTAVADGSVALVVTSPPYFAGKQYEEELQREGVPSSYLEYLEMLTDVFRDCVRTLEPGGRIAVNVANLGRKPYRSLSADVIRILEHDLGLLLRGELIWQKAEGASGSCAWGSFRSATNPVLRDISERVIVASKGRFDRARSVKQRAAEQLPHTNTMSAEDFMALTLDVWSIPPESARRIGHPAPFPIELPEQLIRLYTFENDLVLDPFMGSGSSLVAAARLGRRYVGYDLDAEYVELARHRVATEVDTTEVEPIEPGGADDQTAHRLAGTVLEACGFTITAEQRRIAKSGVAVSWEALDQTGGRWWFDVAGPNTNRRGGLTRTETALKALGRAVAIKGRVPDARHVVLTTTLPANRSEADTLLHAAGPNVLFDVIGLLDDADRERLTAYGQGGVDGAPAPGFWTSADLARWTPVGTT